MQRLILILSLCASGLFCSIKAANSDAVVGHSINFWPGHQYGEVTDKIKLLGAVNIQGKYLDQEITGLSGLAWDQDQQILYAISDHGVLFHFRPVFQNHTLHSLELIQAFNLLNEKNEPLLDIKQRDAEGLSLLNHNNNIKNDTKVYISFERNPRVWQFNNKGEFINNINLPEYLNDIRNYKRPNNALESLVILDEKTMITVPERPLKNDIDDTISVFFDENVIKKLPLTNRDVSGIAAIEQLDDKTLLILERGYRKRFFPELTIKLKKWNHEKNILTTLATFKNDGEFLTDNFEGLTKHEGNKYFMVSDDNSNSYQKTILLYFEIIE